MKRLTVHLENVEKVNVNGKSKLFNTLSFKLKKGTPEEINTILGSLEKVKTSYTSNIL